MIGAPAQAQAKSEGRSSKAENTTTCCKKLKDPAKLADAEGLSSERCSAPWQAPEINRRQGNTSNAFGQPGRKAVERGGSVKGCEPDVKEAEGCGGFLSFIKGEIQLFFGLDNKPAAGTQNLPPTMILPAPDVVIAAVLHMAFGA